MKQVFKTTIQGESPLVMHNPQLSNPFNPFCKGLKQISGKRDKTEADLLEMSKIEWYGGLYLLSGKPCIPGRVIEATLEAAAAKKKKKKQAKAGLWAEGDFLLHYDGPQDVDALWEDEQFRDIRDVVVGGKRIQRTRPIFHEWSADIEIHFLDNVLNASAIKEFFTIAGLEVGLMEMRPRYGRFKVVV